jgi:sulfoxide reductase heme-binding subunit YedZ
MKMHTEGMDMAWSRVHPCYAPRTVPACLAAFVAAVLAVVLGQMLGADLLERWLLSTRFTARTSFVIFLFAYTAPALVGRREGSLAWAIARRRCDLALSFAVVHTVHLMCLLAYAAFNPEPTPTISIVVGGTGYALLYAMLATGWAWIDSGGARWGRLHSFGPHYLGIVVLLTYVSRVAERGVAWLPFVVLTLGAFAIRMAAGPRATKEHAAAEAG